MPPHPCTDLLTHTHTHTTYNLQHQHVPSHFPIEHMVRREKTKHRLTSPLHSARGQTCFLFTSDQIHLHGLQSTQLWLGFHACIPVIIQTCIAKRSLSLACLPRVLFHRALLCFKYGSTSKQWNGQTNSFRNRTINQLKTNAILWEIQFRIQSLRHLL